MSLCKVGRTNCPHCDGVLIFLPKTCPMCSIDYLTTPKPPNYCNFCGYRLEYPEHLEFYAEEAERLSLMKDTNRKSDLAKKDNNSFKNE